MDNFYTNTQDLLKQVKSSISEGNEGYCYELMKAAFRELDAAGTQEERIQAQQAVDACITYTVGLEASTGFRGNVYGWLTKNGESFKADPARKSVQTGLNKIMLLMQ